MEQLNLDEGRKRKLLAYENVGDPKVRSLRNTHTRGEMGVVYGVGRGGGGEGPNTCGDVVVCALCVCRVPCASFSHTRSH